MGLAPEHPRLAVLQDSIEPTPAQMLTRVLDATYDSYRLEPHLTQDEKDTAYVNELKRRQAAKLVNKRRSALQRVVHAFEADKAPDKTVRHRKPSADASAGFTDEESFHDYFLQCGVTPMNVKRLFTLLERKKLPHLPHVVTLRTDISLLHNKIVPTPESHAMLNDFLQSFDAYHEGTKARRTHGRIDDHRSDLLWAGLTPGNPLDPDKHASLLKNIDATFRAQRVPKPAQRVEWVRSMWYRHFGEPNSAMDRHTTLVLERLAECRSVAPLRTVFRALLHDELLSCDLLTVIEFALDYVNTWHQVELERIVTITFDPEELIAARNKHFGQICNRPGVAEQLSKWRSAGDVHAAEHYLSTKVGPEAYARAIDQLHEPLKVMRRKRVDRERRDAQDRKAQLNEPEYDSEGFFDTFFEDIDIPQLAVRAALIAGVIVNAARENWVGSIMSVATLALTFATAENYEFVSDTFVNLPPLVALKAWWEKNDPSPAPTWHDIRTALKRDADNLEDGFYVFIEAPGNDAQAKENAIFVPQRFKDELPLNYHARCGPVAYHLVRERLAYEKRKDQLAAQGPDDDDVTDANAATAFYEGLTKTIGGMLGSAFDAATTPGVLRMAKAVFAMNAIRLGVNWLWQALSSVITAVCTTALGIDPINTTGEMGMHCTSLFVQAVMILPDDIKTLQQAQEIRRLGKMYGLILTQRACEKDVRVTPAWVEASRRFNNLYDRAMIFIKTSRVRAEPVCIACIGPPATFKTTFMNEFMPYALSGILADKGEPISLNNVRYMAPKQDTFWDMFTEATRIVVHEELGSSSNPQTNQAQCDGLLDLVSTAPVCVWKANEKEKGTLGFENVYLVGLCSTRQQASAAHFQQFTLGGLTRRMHIWGVPAENNIDTPVSDRLFIVRGGSYADCLVGYLNRFGLPIIALDQHDTVRCPGTDWEGLYKLPQAFKVRYEDLASFVVALHAQFRSVSHTTDASLADGALPVVPRRDTSGMQFKAKLVNAPTSGMTAPMDRRGGKEAPSQKAQVHPKPAAAAASAAPVDDPLGAAVASPTITYEEFVKQLSGKPKPKVVAACSLDDLFASQDAATPTLANQGPDYMAMQSEAAWVASYIRSRNHEPVKLVCLPGTVRGWREWLSAHEFAAKVALAVFGLLATGFAAWAVYRRVTEPSAESPRDLSPKSGVHTGRFQPATGSRRVRFHPTEAQAKPGSTTITDSGLENHFVYMRLVYATAQEDGKLWKTAEVKGIAVGPSTVLTYAHCLPSDMNLIEVRIHTRSAIVSNGIYHHHAASECEFAMFPDMDLFAITVPTKGKGAGPAFKSCYHKLFDSYNDFPTNWQIQMMDYQANVEKGLWIDKQYTALRYNVSPVPEKYRRDNDKPADVTSAGHMTYDLATGTGMCGAAIVLTNPNNESQRRIAAIHVAGNKMTRGVGLKLSKEFVDWITLNITPHQMLESEGPLVETFAEQQPFGAVITEDPKTVCGLEWTHHVEPGFFPPTRSSYVVDGEAMSLLEEVFPGTTAASAIRRHGPLRNSEGEVVVPHFVQAYANKWPIVEDYEGLAFPALVEHRFMRECRPIEHLPLHDHDNEFLGCGHCETRSIQLATSGGFGVQSKKSLFDINRNTTPFMQEVLDDMDWYVLHDRVRVVRAGCMVCKDEVKPSQIINNQVWPKPGRTVIAAECRSWYGRGLYGEVLWCLKQPNPRNIRVGLGTSITPAEWASVRLFLAEARPIGNSVAAWIQRNVHPELSIDDIKDTAWPRMVLSGDISSQDKCWQARHYQFVARIYKKLVVDSRRSDEENIERLLKAEQLYHSAFESVLVYKNHLMAKLRDHLDSGALATAKINTGGTIAGHIDTIARIADDNDMVPEELLDVVASIHYGDDFSASLPKPLAELVHKSYATEFGKATGWLVTGTDKDKGVDLCPLDDATFLSRGLKGFYAPLELETIVRVVTHRKRIMRPEEVQCKYDVVLDEMYQRQSREDFAAMRDALRNLSYFSAYHLRTKSWHECHDSYWRNQRCTIRLDRLYDIELNADVDDVEAYTAEGRVAQDFYEAGLHAGRQDHGEQMTLAQMPRIGENSIPHGVGFTTLPNESDTSMRTTDQEFQPCGAIQVKKKTKQASDATNAERSTMSVDFTFQVTSLTGQRTFEVPRLADDIQLLNFNVSYPSTSDTLFYRFKPWEVYLANAQIADALAPYQALTETALAPAMLVLTITFNAPPFTSGDVRVITVPFYRDLPIDNFLGTRKFGWQCQRLSEGITVLKLPIWHNNSGIPLLRSDRDQENTPWEVLIMGNSPMMLGATGITDVLGTMNVTAHLEGAKAIGQLLGASRAEFHMFLPWVDGVIDGPLTAESEKPTAGRPDKLLDPNDTGRSVASKQAFPGMQPGAGRAIARVVGTVDNALHYAIDRTSLAVTGLQARVTPLAALSERAVRKLNSIETSDGPRQGVFELHPDDVTADITRRICAFHDLFVASRTTVDLLDEDVRVYGGAVHDGCELFAHVADYNCVAMRHELQRDTERAWAAFSANMENTMTTPALATNSSGKTPVKDALVGVLRSAANTATNISFKIRKEQAASVAKKLMGSLLRVGECINSIAYAEEIWVPVSLHGLYVQVKNKHGEMRVAIGTPTFLSRNHGKRIFWRGITVDGPNDSAALATIEQAIGAYDKVVGARMLAPADASDIADLLQFTRPALEAVAVAYAAHPGYEYNEHVNHFVHSEKYERAANEAARRALLVEYKQSLIARGIQPAEPDPDLEAESDPKSVQTFKEPSSEAKAREAGASSAMPDLRAAIDIAGEVVGTVEKLAPIAAMFMGNAISDALPTKVANYPEDTDGPNAVFGTGLPMTTSALRPRNATVGPNDTTFDKFFRRNGMIDRFTASSTSQLTVLHPWTHHANTDTTYYGNAWAGLAYKARYAYEMMEVNVTILSCSTMSSTVVLQFFPAGLDHVGASVDAGNVVRINCEKACEVQTTMRVPFVSNYDSMPTCPTGDINNALLLRSLQLPCLVTTLTSNVSLNPGMAPYVVIEGHWEGVVLIGPEFPIYQTPTYDETIWSDLPPPARAKKALAAAEGYDLLDLDAEGALSQPCLEVNGSGKRTNVVYGRPVFMGTSGAGPCTYEAQSASAGKKPTLSTPDPWFDVQQRLNCAFHVADLPFLFVPMGNGMAMLRVAMTVGTQARSNNDDSILLVMTHTSPYQECILNNPANALTDNFLGARGSYMITLRFMNQTDNNWRISINKVGWPQIYGSVADTGCTRHGMGPVCRDTPGDRPILVPVLDSVEQGFLPSRSDVTTLFSAGGMASELTIMFPSTATSNFYEMAELHIQPVGDMQLSYPIMWPSIPNPLNTLIPTPGRDKKNQAAAKASRGKKNAPLRQERPVNLMHLISQQLAELITIARSSASGPANPRATVSRAGMG